MTAFSVGPFQILKTVATTASRLHGVGRCVLLCALSVLLVGCGGYTLQGRVIRGDFSEVRLVPSDSALLDGQGVGRVQVVLDRDPDSLGRERVAEFRTNTDGTFSVPISAFGAGWMDEAWLLETMRPGYSNTKARIRLPDGDSEQLLIILAPGGAIPLDGREDLMEQYREFR